MFWTFEHLNFGFVSNFDIRISDLFSLKLATFQAGLSACEHAQAGNTPTGLYFFSPNQLIFLSIYGI
jgi:hypothetical protein